MGLCLKLATFHDISLVERDINLLNRESDSLFKIYSISFMLIFLAGICFFACFWVSPPPARNISKEVLPKWSGHANS